MDRNRMVEGLDPKNILFGLFFSFDNRLQAAGDSFYEGITSKQFFLSICLSLFREKPPTLNELSEVMGSSHQNVKQIVNKMEANGFLKTFQDEQDRRKTRVVATEQLMQLHEQYQNKGEEFMEKLYSGLSGEEIQVTLNAMTKIENNLIKIREERK